MPITLLIATVVGGENKCATHYVGTYRGPAAFPPRAWMLRKMREGKIVGRLIEAQEA